MIARQDHIRLVRRALRENPVVALLGARQVGKTTLAAAVAKAHGQRTTTFDLEDPRQLAFLEEPTLALESLRGLVVLDEIQRRPELFPVLRVLADRKPRPARFLVLGSASPDLLKQSSESLAGRISYYELRGFDLTEVGEKPWERLWFRGGFPRSFLARSHRESVEWREAFIRTFLQRDLPQLGITIPSGTLRDFWTMLAHYHAQTWNGAELARAFGVAHTTVRRYLNLLSDTFVVRQLRPFLLNVGKRVVRSPKIYIADPGLFHALMGIRTPSDLKRHPKVGASFEGFGLEQVLVQLRAKQNEAFFWGTHAGAELDLLVVHGRRRLGFEFKRTDAPRVTRSMRSALETLKLDSLTVVHVGEHTFPLQDGVQALSISNLTALKPLRR